MEHGNAFTISGIWGPLVVAGDDPARETGLLPLPELDGIHHATSVVDADTPEPALTA